MRRVYLNTLWCIAGLSVLLTVVQSIQAQIPNSLVINTQTVVRDTYPQIFGLTNNPDPHWTDAWNRLDEASVTMIRKDYNIETLVPTTTIADYKANKNNVQSISTWSQTFLQYHYNIYTTARAHQMQTLGIIDYTPAWLTYSNTTKGVPKDWEIWEDLVRKSHTYFMDSLDAVEIWNEPNYYAFLNIDGSPYTSRAAAYIDLFKHTYNAVRAVDPDIPIGGPAGYTSTDQDFLRSILADQFVREHLDFITVHSYPRNNPYRFDATLATRTVLAEYGLQNLPISVSEWNYTSNVPDDRNTEPAGISFIGKNWLDFWRNGVISAHYYVGRPYTAPGVMSFYTWENQVAALLPQTRAFRLTSGSLAMGEGKGKLLSTSVSGIVDGVGLVNPHGKFVAFMVNDSASTQSGQITFTNLPPLRSYTVSYFEASATNEGKTAYKIETLSSTADGQLSLLANTPRTSVLGILLEENLAEVCKADVDQDGVVDLSDYSLLISVFLKSNSTIPRADINQDGVVDLSDYSLLVRSFLSSCPT